MIVFRDLASSLSERQRIVLALSKTVSASLSLFASSIIIYKIYLRFKARPKSSTTVSSSLRSSRKDSITAYHRMILSTSILDVVHSISSALSTVVVPPSTGAVFAHGTIGTCAAQGLFQQLTPTIVIYMATMNTYFMLKIRYNIPDSVFQRKYELFFHAVPIGFFLITGITGLSLKVFNAIVLPELGCWLGSYPRGCIFTNTCTRGYKVAEYIDWYAWGFGYFWLFLCVAVVLVNSVLIYSTIQNQEKRNANYFAARLQSEATSGNVVAVSSSISVSLDEFDLGDEQTPSDDSERYQKKEGAVLKPKAAPSGANITKLTDDATSFVHNSVKNSLTSSSTTQRHVRESRNVKKSRIAAVQSGLYVASAFFTAIWIFMPWLGSKLGVQTQWRFFFAFMVNIVSPSQGLFSLFVFVRLQYLRLRESNKDWSHMRCVKHCLFSSESN
jgi:hypothetical protein